MRPRVASDSVRPMAPPREAEPEALHAEIEELFAELWQVPRFAGLRRGFRPNVDSYHTDEPHELTVVVEVPGIDPKSLTIVVGERTLADRRRAGARRAPAGASTSRWRSSTAPSSGRSGSRGRRPGEGARPTYEHGIVTISLPVAEKPPPAAARTRFSWSAR